jgi:hypothetical protein
MAYYKTFPTQDSTLYSSYPEMNTGLDAMCEVSNIFDIGGNPGVSRFLTLFDNDEITDIIDNKINGKEFSVYFLNSIATAQGINADVKVEVHPVAQQWNNGTGYYGNSPQTKDGVSWDYASFLGTSPWSLSGTIGGYAYAGYIDPAYVTGGGGNWFTTESLSVTHSFGLRSSKDLAFPVTNIVNSWYSSSIPNYGFITKLSSSFEFNSNQHIQPILKYYSVDTNTIYPPQLEFRWRDYTTVLNGPAAADIVTDQNIKVSLTENHFTFHPDSVNRFHINVSPTYPVRVFQTSSLFTAINYLPTSSYYSIKDLATNEIIINFDENYTQISSDANGNYFDVYMSGLEPERYYKILIKTVINDSILILDDDYYFKVNN